MSIQEAMEHAAKGLLEHVDLPDTMCRVEIEIPRPPVMDSPNHNFRTNPQSALTNKINLIKFARVAQSAFTKWQKDQPPTEAGKPASDCMPLQDARKLVESFIAEIQK